MCGEHHIGHPVGLVSCNPLLFQYIRIVTCQLPKLNVVSSNLIGRFETAPVQHGPRLFLYRLYGVFYLFAFLLLVATGGMAGVILGASTSRMPTMALNLMVGGRA